MLLDRIASYWDLRADGYSDSIHMELSGETREQYRGWLLSALPEGDHLECLDMGCGPGFFTLILGQEGHHVTSADYSPEMLEYTRRNCEEVGLVAHTVRADAQNLPFEDNTFDFLCSRNLVWNLEKPEQAYSEWFRVLKPGGRLFIFDGNHYLYYYDDDYRKAREQAEAQSSRDHHTMKGVDPTPINEIARELPLSRCHRPEWDIEALTKAGFQMLDIDRFTRAFVNPETHQEKQLVHSFIIRAEKP